MSNSAGQAFPRPLKNKFVFCLIKSYYGDDLWCGEYAKKEPGRTDGPKGLDFLLIVTDRRRTYCLLTDGFTG